MLPKKDELIRQIDIAPWDLLRAHLERGGLILVSSELDLADVAFNIATDNKNIIERWLANSLLSKPGSDQIQQWDNLRHKKIFTTIIISPFVLVQEVA